MLFAFCLLIFFLLNCDGDVRLAVHAADIHDHGYRGAHRRRGGHVHRDRQHTRYGTGRRLGAIDRRGLAADLFVFDPTTIDLLPPEKINDLPEGASRYIQGAKGIHYTIVNGSVLMKNGAHTGVYPGKILRSV